jgi:uncharacterized protein YtpQ (UPF0354 family)
MPKEPEAFSEAVAQLIHRMAPDRRIELPSPFEMLIDGRHLALENLYRMVCADPESGVEIVEQFLDHLLDGDEATTISLPYDLARPRIMPRIQPESIFAHLDPRMVAHAPFVNDTVVLYVIDMPNLTVSITVEQMLKWGITIDDIDSVARTNLKQTSERIDMRVVDLEGGGKAIILHENDGYDASRLLLDTLHENIAPHLGRDFLVATPARDAFIAVATTPSELPGKILPRAPL